jgi:ribokinase
MSKGCETLNILVIGSFMMDLVVKTPKIPRDGETVIGTQFKRFPGGKGANQAVAAARLGGNVTMVGKLGNDLFGDDMYEVMVKENINTKHILRDKDTPTGIGSITLDSKGNNRIIVVPGANLQFTIQDLMRIKHLIKSADLLMVQFEMDHSMIEHAVELAFTYDVPVIVNPAPAREISEHLFKKISYLTPNETEAELLTGIKVRNIEEAKAAGRILLEKGVRNVVITLADKGAVVIESTGVTYVSGVKVDSKDTVAAGDAFNGALAVGIVAGKPLPKAVQYANAAGALTVTKEGAIPSLPYLNELEGFLKQKSIDSLSR